MVVGMKPLLDDCIEANMFPVRSTSRKPAYSGGGRPEAYIDGTRNFLCILDSVAGVNYLADFSYLFKFSCLRNF